MREVRHVHSLALTPVWQVAPHPEASEREAPGMFREYDLHPFTAGMTPPNWPLIASLMQDLLDRVHELTSALTGREPTATPLPELLADLHNGFERVHPFIDGNGRAGRLVLNLVLVRLAYPPAIILKSHRERCLDAMQKADSGDVAPLGKTLARAIYDNINRFVLPSIAGQARLVPLAALASKDFTLASLRQAAQTGHLRAGQASDGVWQSTRQDVKE